MSIDPSKAPDEDYQPDQQHAETDSEKITHRHLRNKDDVITDDDIRNIRVGEINEPDVSGSAAPSYLTDEQQIKKSESQNNDL